jgi:Spa2 homology domain (SHD) of GIT
MDEKKYAAMEAALGEHHRTLLKYLARYLRELRADPRQNRARDKLLRLSMSQFQELSTDVYDELTRREDERKRGGPEQPGNPIPKYLLPQTNFHFKRNQARQKLSTLPGDRFQQLATDVFFELERRFPRFARSPSRAESIPDRNSPSRNGLAPRGPSRQGGPDMRSVSREGFRGTPPYGPGGPGASGGPGTDNFGKPLPKMYQSNVMVPNKGTMVEDDSDAEGARSMMMNGGESPDSKSEYRIQVQDLERKVDDLMSQLQEKDKELEQAKSSSRENDSVGLESQEPFHDADNVQTIEAERSEWNLLRNDLDAKLSEAKALNDSLQKELVKLRSKHTNLEEELRVKADGEANIMATLEQTRRDAVDRERALQSQFDDHQSATQSKHQDLLAELEQVRNQHAMQSYGDSEAWKERCEILERDLAEQRKRTEDVRQETGKFLQEMRTLSQRSTESVEKEEKLLDQMVQLEREVRLWKSRYAKSKSQARSLRSSSLGLQIANNAAAYLAQDATFIAENGAIRDVHLTNFQVAVDDLLQQARTSDPQFISESMKQLIMAVRAITNDMEAAAPEVDENLLNKRTKLRARLSQAANNLISATKAHGASNGLAPVSIVDAATLHLTTAVVDIAKLLKIRQSTPDELAQEDYVQISLSARPAPLSTRSKGNSLSESSAASATHARNASVSSAGFSNYSRYSSRYSVGTSPDQLSADMKGAFATPQILGMLRENGIEEFKNYLEDSTALLVRSIQPLVNTIRNGSPKGNDDQVVADYIRDIDGTVQDIVTKTNAALADLKDPALSKHAPPVVKALQGTVQDLQRTYSSGQRDRIPPLAFKVARATKELVLRVDRIETGEVTVDTNLPADF